MADVTTMLPALMTPQQTQSSVLAKPDTPTRALAQLLFVKVIIISQQ